MKDEINIPWFVTAEYRHTERQAHEIARTNAARTRARERRRKIERQQRRDVFICSATAAAMLALLMWVMAW